ncbi:MAG: hypothetical protein NNA22_06170 [Nitrospira sp.]|nr:hypothetical protein [Nitrospira sp.]
MALRRALTTCNHETGRGIDEVKLLIMTLTPMTAERNGGASGRCACLTIDGRTDLPAGLPV